MLKFRHLNLIKGAALLGIALASAYAYSAPDGVPAPYPAAGDSLTDNTSFISVGLSDTELHDENSPEEGFFCLFRTHGDYVHVSKNRVDASGHGWWENIDCRATRGLVTVQLQEYYSDGSWRNKGEQGRKIVGPGGGSGKRANGRTRCHDSTITGWRSVVVTDLFGVFDITKQLSRRPETSRADGTGKTKQY